MRPLASRLSKPRIPLTPRGGEHPSVPVRGRTPLDAVCRPPDLPSGMLEPAAAAKERTPLPR